MSRYTIYRVSKKKQSKNEKRFLIEPRQILHRARNFDIRGAFLDRVQRKSTRVFDFFFRVYRMENALRTSLCAVLELWSTMNKSWAQSRNFCSKLSARKFNFSGRRENSGSIFRALAGRPLKGSTLPRFVVGTKSPFVRNTKWNIVLAVSRRVS